MTKKEQDVIINEAVKRLMESKEEIYRERDIVWVQALQKYAQQDKAIDFYHKEILHDYVDSKDLEIMSLKQELKEANKNVK